MPTADPVRSVPKIASKLGLNEKTQQTSIELLHRAEQKKAIAGKDPMGLAAAAIYIACVIDGERKTQKEIAEAAGVTEVTVRNRYKGLRRTLKLEV
jgi:transcription initiation factor TFIIB